MSTFKKLAAISAAFLILFIIFTVSLTLFDVQPIGPENSSVGYSSVNGAVNSMILQIDVFDLITDVIRLLCYAVCGVFAVIGVYQLIKRKSLFRVDADILAMGVCYIVLFATYILFELITVNYRPVLEDGVLKGSYPSSHLLAAVVILVTACIFIGERKLLSKQLRIAAYVLSGIFCLLTAAGRLICKAHWFTDIFGALILSGFFVFAYIAALDYINSGKTLKNGKYRSTK